MRVSRSAILALGVLPVCLGLSACTGYVQRAAPPYEVVWLRPARAIFATEGREIELARPRVVADSVVGTTTDRFGQSAGHRVSLPLESIDWVATEEVDKTRAFQGLGGFLLVLLYAPFVGALLL